MIIGLALGEPQTIRSALTNKGYQDLLISGSYFCAKTEKTRNQESTYLK
jgi:hypothetical protein